MLFSQPLPDIRLQYHCRKRSLQHPCWQIRISRITACSAIEYGYTSWLSIHANDLGIIRIVVNVVPALEVRGEPV
jgi:hypothetical protein